MQLTIQTVMEFYKNHGIIMDELPIDSQNYIWDTIGRLSSEGKTDGHQYGDSYVSIRHWLNTEVAEEWKVVVTSTIDSSLIKSIQILPI